MAKEFEIHRTRCKIHQDGIDVIHDYHFADRADDFAKRNIHLKNLVYLGFGTHYEVNGIHQTGEQYFHFWRNRDWDF